jgi:hypothetical protein
MALAAEFKRGGNAIYTVKNTTLGQLEPAELARAPTILRRTDNKG